MVKKTPKPARSGPALGHPELLLRWVSGCWGGGLQTPEQTSSDSQGSLSEDGNPTAIRGFAPFQAAPRGLGWVLGCPSNPSLPTVLLLPAGKAPGVNPKPHRAAHHHCRALDSPSTPLLLDGTPAGFPLRQQRKQHLQHVGREKANNSERGTAFQSIDPPGTAATSEQGI